MRRKPVAAARVSLVAVAMALASPAGATESPAVAPQPGLVEQGAGKRLVVGARFGYLWLEDSRRSGPDGYDNGNKAGNFLGSLWGIDPQQRALPLPFLEYRVARGFGVGIAYDRARAKTLDWSDEDRITTSGDGDLEIQGVQTYVFGRLRNRTRLTPQADFGYGWYRSRFFTSPGWAAPGRSFAVDGTRGWVAGVGCRLDTGRHLGLEASFRHLNVGSVKALADFGPGQKPTKGAFPMRNDRMAIGISYSF